MEIKINVSDEKFTEVVQNEIDALSKEELGEIVKNGIKDFMESEKGIALIKDKFLVKRTYYGSNTEDLNPWIIDYLSKSIKESDINEKIKDVGDAMVNYLKENKEQVLKNALTSLFIGNINNILWSSPSFNANIENTIRTIIHQNM